MKLSAIISWPDSFDFPLFRRNLSKLQERVDEVILCFNSHGNHSLRDWLRQNMPGVVFLDVEDCINKSGDWRNKSTNYMINSASGDWILSLEQDFFIKDYPHFFHTVKQAMDKHDVIMFEEGVRFHPACMFFTREVINKTRRDFSVMGDGRDHFAEITKQFKGMAKYISLKELDLLEGRDWLHLQGLTDNYFAPKPYFDLPTFYTYNEACKSVEPMSEYWMSEMNRRTVPAGEQTKPIGDFI
jgi:hypothetical protein